MSKPKQKLSKIARAPRTGFAITEAMNLMRKYRSARDRASATYPGMSPEPLNASKATNRERRRQWREEAERSGYLAAADEWHALSRQLHRGMKRLLSLRSRSPADAADKIAMVLLAQKGDFFEIEDLERDVLPALVADLRALHRRLTP